MTTVGEVDTSAPYRRHAPGEPIPSRPADLARQVVVLASVVFMLIAAAVGTGALGGTSVQNLQNGALDVDGSLLAPGRPAFSIWSVIYVGLIAYAVWQALPAQRARPRQRRIGWWIAGTAVLNGLWLVAAQFTTLPVTVAGIVILLIALCITFRLTVRHPADGVWSAWLIDVVTGLHLGWVSLATVANTAAWLTASEVSVPAPDAWGVAVVIVVAVIGMAVGFFSGGRFAPGLAMAWGLSWLAYERLTGSLPSTPIAIAAIVAAVAILAVPAVIRVRRIVRTPAGVAPAR